jgi:hypothetical protein
VLQVAPVRRARRSRVAVARALPDRLALAPSPGA